MVEFADGSTVAQLSLPDMRLPIGYALGYPRRLSHAFGALDWSVTSHLDFELPDRSVFRCLALAEEAGRAGGLVPAWLNAANEVAVAAFLDGRIAWGAIAAVVGDTVSAYDSPAATDAGDVIEADRRARERAEAAVSRLGRAA
jgi:1-deoxy-D-xylulose-5-phosphate reductoisomerase